MEGRASDKKTSKYSEGYARETLVSWVLIYYLCIFRQTFSKPNQILNKWLYDLQNTKTFINMIYL